MYQRFMLMDQQIKKKGMMSDQIISEVRTSKDGFIVYVVDHTPLQIKKGFLFHGDDWTEDMARELFREANDIISKKGEAKFAPVKVMRERPNGFRLIMSDEGQN